jgi:transcriptional regulator GlxA family with amidase domain
LVIIASATYIKQILEKNPELVPWICRQYQQGAHVARICTGVFLLAETAKSLLEEGSQTFNDITYQVGYEDISFFRILIFMDRRATN